MLHLGNCLGYPTNSGGGPHPHKKLDPSPGGRLRASSRCTQPFTSALFTEVREKLGFSEVRGMERAGTYR